MSVPPSDRRPPELAADERALLLDVARQAILARLDGERVPPLPHAPIAEQLGGAFVSLHVDGELRGCIGIPEARQALGPVVQHCAQAAAFEDPRFASIGHRDVAGLAIEISVLSPLRPLGVPADIVIGRDGLVVAQGWQRGLLLPQVAAEHRWGPEEFLRQTCRKAGLPTTAWQHGATVEVFTADVFAEHRR